MSLPLKVEPSPQMLTPSSSHGGDQHGAGDGASEGRGVEVGDARGRDVKRARPAGRRCLRAPGARGSRSDGLFPRRIRALCAGWRRSRPRPAARGWPCRRRAVRPSASSSAGQRWCRGRRKKRCRLFGRPASFQELQTFLCLCRAASAAEPFARACDSRPDRRRRTAGRRARRR